MFSKSSSWPFLALHTSAPEMLKTKGRLKLPVEWWSTICCVPSLPLLPRNLSSSLSDDVVFSSFSYLPGCVNAWGGRHFAYAIRHRGRINVVCRLPNTACGALWATGNSAKSGCRAAGWKINPWWREAGGRSSGVLTYVSGVRTSPAPGPPAGKEHYQRARVRGLEGGAGCALARNMLALKGLAGLTAAVQTLVVHH